MHFDTEEGLLYAHHEVVHPAVSSVLYLSDAEVRASPADDHPSQHRVSRGGVVGKVGDRNPIFLIWA